MKMPLLSPTTDSTRTPGMAQGRFRAGRGGGGGGLLAGMRIRRKLIVLHTIFWLALAGVLWLTLRPAIAEVVRRAEEHEASVVLRSVLNERANPALIAKTPSLASTLDAENGATVRVRFGGPEAVQISGELADIARTTGTMVTTVGPDRSAIVAAYEQETGQFISVGVVLDGAREAVGRLWRLMALALLIVYAMVAAALELLVLPAAVYAPIRRLLDADSAVREGRQEHELIPEAQIPADELGEIMRSRNETTRALRQHERDLAQALGQLEVIANDLKQKNHLIETAQRNLADAGRLVSLGMMSAGIAHELNTPLAVLKGLVEKVKGDAHRLSAGGSGVTPEEVLLMRRVLGRLERLSESLLDFARARPSRAEAVMILPLVEEAWTLVSLDRGAREVLVTFDVPAELRAWCDADRIVQVLVNLLRNAVDAMHERKKIATTARPAISVEGRLSERGGASWAVLTVSDTGPGIDAEMLERLFQPFASTRLDAKGTGLGLAVAEGIVREHGGVILARNRTNASGAIFEIVLPIGPSGVGEGPGERANPSNQSIVGDRASVRSVQHTEAESR